MRGYKAVGCFIVILPVHLVFQPVGSVVHGIEFSVTDPDDGDTHQYQVIGAGASTEPRYFSTHGNQLVVSHEVLQNIIFSTNVDDN